MPNNLFEDDFINAATAGINGNRIGQVPFARNRAVDAIAGLRKAGYVIVASGLLEHCLGLLESPSTMPEEDIKLAVSQLESHLKES